jgi:hypothetical protein
LIDQWNNVRIVDLMAVDEVGIVDGWNLWQLE